jgi:uncharacterized membrane protein
MVTKDKAYSKAAIRIIGFALLVSFFAVLSGLNDADKIIAGHSIVKEGMDALGNHKLFGFVVVAILLITTIVKWFAISKDSAVLENLSIVLIILVLMTSLYQGRSGGSIVYQYAGGIDSKVVRQRVSQGEK